jgi:ATP-dependent DNA helicase RecQ
MVQEFLDRCLLLDLEASFDRRILKIGAVFRGRSFEFAGDGSLDEALAGLERFGGEAELVLGHNVLDHDLPLLALRAPGLELLKKPVIDTLYLSPLAFPENPYHRLVKGYKLVRDTASDPVADARLAARLFADAWESLAAAARGEPALPAFYALCFEALPGLGAMLTELAGRPAMAAGEAPDYLAARCADLACAPALAERAAHGLADAAGRMAWGFALAWLRVAGAASVLPRWVAARYPRTTALLDALRGRPCAGAGCAYCRGHHDLRRSLQQLFGLDEFRALPATAAGESLQRTVAARGVAGGSLLAMLPTGSGKSLCYQLPALIRHRQRGELTIVLSPLQALMQDQVTNLHARTGFECAATINGLLTPPERGAALEKVRLGGIAILYVSPEQLRNRSFRRAVEQREIAAWVFDEAHCLSKWGHDFRPDYLYAGRFICDLARRQGRAQPPPVACFTATAKPDVAREIREHFKAELGAELAVFGGNLRRPELRFAVEKVAAAAKLARVHALATATLAAAAPGSAAVAYFATRGGAERAAAFLKDRGLAAAAFHAGLRPPEKRRIQQRFAAGELTVVCATNAFGLGIDKDNVRLVVHGDLPGSLESYLQEAGRAGRDGREAACVLLFAESDVERQFRLAAASRLSRRDIAQILRGLRRLARRHAGGGGGGGGGEVVVTSGELLASDEVETSFEAGDRDADTKVKTAVAWLERAQLVERNQNRTRVFSGRPRLASLAEAARRIDERAPELPAAERQVWLAIFAAILDCPPDGGLTADELVELPALAALAPAGDGDPGSHRDAGKVAGAGGGPDSGEAGSGSAASDGVEGRAASGPRETAGEAVLRILDRMAALDLVESGMQLTAFLKPRGRGAAGAAFAELCRMERMMLEELAAQPDAAAAVAGRGGVTRTPGAAGAVSAGGAAGAAGGWQEVSLSWLSQTLRGRGLAAAHPETLRRLLAGLAREGSGEPGRASLLALAHRSRYRYRLRLARGWGEVLKLAEGRRAVAGCVLAALVARAPAGGRRSRRCRHDRQVAQATVQVAFSIEDLAAALRDDLAAPLRNGAPPPSGGDLEAAAPSAGLGPGAYTPEPAAAAERALLMLHDLEVIQLQQGLAVFRQAMTIRLRAGKQGVRYSKDDYQPLAEHYRERTFQIHVMARYAELGLEDADRALALVDDYFTLEKAEFAARHFPHQAAMLARPTGRESYRQIVECLGNAAQTALVTAPAESCLLVLAGPGSGKTRVVVHRCAYLLRVERVPPAAILVLCFNRSAAREVARRLRELAGDDARGVTVQTYHGLALRLTGGSLAAAAAQAGMAAGAAAAEPDFAGLIADANELLRQGGSAGEAAPGAAAEAAPESAAWLRDRILAGFSHVLVDEYQDINEAQYELIGHLAGRREDEPDRRLSILAVGDDDQTIYGWNGANVEFLRRFQEDYPGTEVHFLVENYRSSPQIVACAERLIRHNRDRLKHGHPARVAARRAPAPQPTPGCRAANGGAAAAACPVRVLRVADGVAQAAAVVEHLFELRRRDPQLAWRSCAVLARTRRELEAVRALCESRGLPVTWAADRDKLPPLSRIREIAELLRSLEARRGESLRSSQLLALAMPGQPGAPQEAAAQAAAAPPREAANPWAAMLREIVRDWLEEIGGDAANGETEANGAGDATDAIGAIDAGDAVELFHRALAERRREPVRGAGVYLGTVHGAKGLEFDHVVLADGGWSPRQGGEDVEAERRLYYVGMTRARHTLALMARREEHNPHLDLIALRDPAASGDLEVVEPVVEAPPAAVLERRFALLGLGDLFLDFAGRRPAGDPLHARLERLRPGDLLTARATPEGWIELWDTAAPPVAVAALSQYGRETLEAADAVEEVRVVAVVERRAADSQPEYQASLRCDRWLVPVVEARYRASRG